MTTDFVTGRLLSKGSIKPLLLLAMLGSFAGSHAQDGDSPFSGTWAGTITIDQAHGFELHATSQRYQFRVSRDGRVRVLGTQGPQRWNALPIPFVLTELGDDAVITGQHEGEFWVESQSFNLTKLDEDRLLVYFWRVVDDIAARADGSAVVWAMGGQGEFQRTRR
jgi:hypothetical protein